MSDNGNSVQVAIVSNQPMANIIAIHQYNPDIVVLLLSRAMSESAEYKHLIAALKLLGYQENSGDKTFIVFEDLMSRDIEALNSYARRVVDTILSVKPEAQIQYNATGGTKLMSLAFARIFEAQAQAGVFYVNTQASEIEHLAPAHRLEDVRPIISLDIFLAAGGVSVDWEQTQSTTPHWEKRIAARKKLTLYLGKNCAQLEGWLGAINSFSYHSYQQQELAVTMKKAPFGDFKQAFIKCAEAGVLMWSAATPKNFQFSCEDSREYLNGGWLEEYAYWQAKQTVPDIIECGLTVQELGNDNNKNELDLLVIHNNKMMVVECKTSKFGRDQQKDNQIIYQLDSLTKKLGGSMAKGVLLSARALDHKTAQDFEVDVTRRATQHNIKTFEKEQLTSFKRYLDSFVRPDLLN